jgi:hypothetical protein
MRIYYTPSQVPMLLDSLSGMTATHESLVSFLRSEQTSIFLAADTSGSAEPYSHLLKGLHIIKSNDPICLTLADDQRLRLEGSVDNLRLYVKYFKFTEKEDEEGRHHHPEYVLENGEPKKGYLSPKTMSLIIEVDTEYINELKTSEQPHQPDAD